MLTVGWYVPTRRWKIDPDRVTASVWIRAGQLIPYLRELGVRCRVNPTVGRTAVVIFVRRQDEVALSYAKSLRRKGTRVVYDLCVNYYDLDSVEPTGLARARREECLRMTDVADAVFCASRFVADRARNFHPNVVYIPDSFDRRHFRFRKDPRDFVSTRLVAGYSGIGQKIRDVAAISEILVATGIDLVVISDDKPDLGFPYEFVRWKYDRFPQDLLRADFCVAPRSLESNYNRGHSFFKVGIFMSQGVPAIAAPVPSYSELIGTSKGGRICHTGDEWFEAMQAISNDRGVLARWSREAVLQTAPYSTESIARKYLEVLTRIDAGQGV